MPGGHLNLKKRVKFIALNGAKSKQSRGGIVEIEELQRFKLYGSQLVLVSDFMRK